MNQPSSNRLIDSELEKQVIAYYEECWLTRFKNGHNPKSLAMHMGYFEDGVVDNDEAKNQMNTFISSELGLTKASDYDVLDAGCGIGGTCFYLTENHPKLSVTGLNLSEAQIEVANQFKSQVVGSQQPNFVVSDYSSTLFEADSFNIIIMVESLCHAEDKSKVFREALRILKPGGILFVLDYVQTDQNLDDQTSTYLSNFETGWAVPQYLNNPIDKLQTVGFDKVDLKSLTSYVLPGIRLSSEKAQEKLKLRNGNSEHGLMRLHLEACLALHHLVLNSIIDYSMIKAYKPY